jgi:predicted kinase
MDAGRLRDWRSVKKVVYVSGAPGAGKTSVAVPLAGELGYALLAKDTIKETLHDALGAPEPTPAWSRRLSDASMELLWTLAAGAPRVVIEANFRPYSDYQRRRLAGLGGRAVEVHCACPAEVAVARYNARARRSHPVHAIPAMDVAGMAEYDRPVGIGTLVTVDTTRPVDVPALAAAVRRLTDRTG